MTQTAFGVATVLSDALRVLTFRRPSPAIDSHWMAYLAFGLLPVCAGSRWSRSPGWALRRPTRTPSAATRRPGFRLYREFQDPEWGPCEYLIAEVQGAG